MSEADRIDPQKLVRRICLDIALLRFFATTGGRGLAVIAAIAAERHEEDAEGAKVLGFVERHVGIEQ